jgi:hypothetical protein
MRTPISNRRFFEPRLARDGVFAITGFYFL